MTQHLFRYTSYPRKKKKKNTHTHTRLHLLASARAFCSHFPCSCRVFVTEIWHQPGWITYIGCRESLAIFSFQCWRGEHHIPIFPQEKRPGVCTLQSMYLRIRSVDKLYWKIKRVKQISNHHHFSRNHGTNAKSWEFWAIFHWSGVNKTTISTTQILKWNDSSFFQTPNSNMFGFHVGPLKPRLRIGSSHSEGVAGCFILARYFPKQKLSKGSSVGVCKDIYIYIYIIQCLHMKVTS